MMKENFDPQILFDNAIYYGMEVFVTDKNIIGTLRWQYMFDHLLSQHSNANFAQRRLQN